MIKLVIQEDLIGYFLFYRLMTIDKRFTDLKFPLKQVVKLLNIPWDYYEDRSMNFLLKNRAFLSQKTIKLWATTFSGNYTILLN